MRPVHILLVIVDPPRLRLRDHDSVPSIVQAEDERRIFLPRHEVISEEPQDVDRLFLRDAHAGQYLVCKDRHVPTHRQTEIVVNRMHVAIEDRPQDELRHPEDLW